MRLRACRFALIVLLGFIGLTLHAQVIERYNFDIKAQSVNSALVELALQLDLNIVYLADLTRDRQANALKGEYTLANALDILLKNSGLRAAISNNRMIQIERLPPSKPQPKPKQPAADPAEPEPPTSKPEQTPAAIEEILIVGKIISPYNLGTTISSTKTQRDFLDTPQIVNALTEELAKDVGARNYAETLLLASSVTYLERSAGVADELRLRGFAYPALKINGIGSHAYVAPVDVAFIERIEIAKGPSSVLFGRMEPGGIVNMMLKQPNGSPSNLSLRYGTDNFRRADLELSWDYSADTSLGVIGFVQRQGSAEDLDLNDAEGLMLTMNHQFSNGSVFNLHYRYESQDVLQQFGSPIEGFDASVEFFENEEGEIEVIVPRRDDLRSGLKINRNSLNLSINDWLINDWSIDAHIQYDQYQTDSFIQFPIIEEFIVEIDDETISNDDLNQALLEDEEIRELLIEGLETVSVDTENIFFEQDEFTYDTQFFSAEFTLHKSLRLGELEFEQLYGANWNRSNPETLIWQTHDTRSNFIPVDQTEVLFSTDVPDIDVTDSNAGVFAQWVFNWMDITAFFGARLDHLEFESNSQSGRLTETFEEQTYRIGLVYALSDNTSLFMDYSESFSPQFDLIEVPNALDQELFSDTAFLISYPEPADSEQIEVGFKRTWLDERLQSSCALFEIEKSNISSNIISQRNRGLECDLLGSLGNGWHITFGLSLLDADITDSFDEEFIGNRPRITPERSLRVWLSKDLPMTSEWETRLGMGYTYIDERFIDSGNEEPLESYQLFDLGITFDYDNRLSFSMLVRNLFDETYTQGVFNALPLWTNPGEKRSLESRFIYRF